ncbi:MAG: hypothetical protein OEZ36_02805 [Spirochaetota bacterium]|nr:hypothetical protein [Spirochaetota bacterium]
MICDTTGDESIDTLSLAGFLLWHRIYISSRKAKCVLGQVSLPKVAVSGKGLIEEIINTFLGFKKGLIVQTLFGGSLRLEAQGDKLG